MTLQGLRKCTCGNEEILSEEDDDSGEWSVFCWVCLTGTRKGDQHTDRGSAEDAWNKGRVNAL